MNTNFEYEWDDIQDKENNSGICDNADIYKLNLKEVNQLIFKKLDEIKSILIDIKEVVNRGRN